MSIPFPEPYVNRSRSSQAYLDTPPPVPPKPSDLGHRYSRSELSTPTQLHHTASTASLSSSYYHGEDSDYATASADSHADEGLPRELTELSLQSEEGVLNFQAGKLPESEQEWYKLVPTEAREALGKKEVQRQSNLFELFKAELDYVADLQAVFDVVVTPLQNSQPPIITQRYLKGFISEVFGNLHQILQQHIKLRDALFVRQREQHPFVISVSDIILETTLKADFRAAYEIYIKHYPISESHHRKEVRRNDKYRAFIQSVSGDPRIRKRDLITFLSRPVTRLLRLNMQLEGILRHTGEDHPDLENLPVSLDIVRDLVKSTEPGIEAAQAKVKFWALCEGLVYQKGEMIDMDLYDDSRTVVHAGPVARKSRSSTAGTSWADLHLALLDNYLILTRNETKSSATVKRYLVSRPLPLAFIRLGSFTDPPDARKEYDKEGSILGLRYHNVPVYPLTVYHASNKANRRYTLYVTSDEVRRVWKSKLENAFGVYTARMEGNMFFSPHTLSDGFFRTTGMRMSSNAIIRGKISCAAPFSIQGRHYLAVGCTSGIWVSQRGREVVDFKRVIAFPSPRAIAAIYAHGEKIFNKLIVHDESTLNSYPLDLVAKVAEGKADAKSLSSSCEKIAGQPKNVVFFRYTHVGPRLLLVYAYRKLLQVSLSLQVVEVLDISESNIAPKRGLSFGRKPAEQESKSFRPYGEAGYVPKDAYDVTALIKTIGVCTADGIVIADPTNLMRKPNVVPNLADASSNMPMATLKSKVEDSKPLGMIPHGEELLVVCDSIGYYVDRHGLPVRNCGYMKWETKVQSYAQRGPHVLLVSEEFIEIRLIDTGRIVQVIEGKGIRLLYGGPGQDAVLVAMKGEHDDAHGVSDKIAELLETSEIQTAHPTSASADLWDEFDA
ncbi:Dbl domain-containing protein [Cylindrobasidium torrendii FP15055 ss-10]|uniref:Dbl domain-containing protein n=1 Tax=Cylindrobasidium torrendii FP15055 ss-10 TaxID=1314674 RepID=A0A0D7BMT8_9AGAR|nr:Dbl domain-containing protein [Cylindrobasidium torrendii FP15055 ss-10]